MKTTQSLLQKGKGFSLLMMLLFAFAGTMVSAQAPATTYLVVTLLKVPPENQAEFEKFVAETWKPVHQLRKQNGKIIHWALFKVHFKGTNDEYNYAAATYYDSFAKTQANDNWAELLKAINPKVDAAAIIAKTLKIRSTVRQGLYAKTESVAGKTPTPFKFAMINYMKYKPGMANEYNRILKEDWKPAHQAIVDAGQMLGWNVWRLVHPLGSEINHDLFTSNLFSSYDQVLMTGYTDTFKKLGKDAQTVSEQSNKAREMTRRELLELVVGLN